MIDTGHVYHIKMIDAKLSSNSSRLYEFWVWIQIFLNPGRQRWRRQNAEISLLLRICFWAYYEDLHWYLLASHILRDRPYQEYAQTMTGVWSNCWYVYIPRKSIHFWIQYMPVFPTLASSLNLCWSVVEYQSYTRSKSVFQALFADECLTKKKFCHSLYGLHTRGGTRSFLLICGLQDGSVQWRHMADQRFKNPLKKFLFWQSSTEDTNMPCVLHAHQLHQSCGG